jgi:integrase
VRIKTLEKRGSLPQKGVRMSVRTRIPSYRLHKQSGQAVVTLPDGLGGRRDVLLGKFDTPESRQEYTRVIAEWAANGWRLPVAAESTDLIVNELLVAYWKHAEEYYGYNREHRRAGYCLRDAMRIVKELYGNTAAKHFGPLALKACRQRMIELDWSRTYINHQVGRLRRMFRWGASEELLPASVFQNLLTVPGLRHGKTPARESKKIRPVAQDRVDATLPFLPQVVKAMVQLQQLAGARPTEICLLRPLDIDMRNPSCWVYRPGSDQGQHGTHKTAHHGQDRLILIGPRAQEVLRPFLGTKVDAYCFSPAKSEEERHIRQRQNRKTPLTPSQKSRKSKTNPKRPKRERYDVTSYRNAIYRACDKAFPPLAPLARGKEETAEEWQARLTPEQREELRAWRSARHWHPNQLRHSRATELRSHGLDVTKTILGHTKVETTQVYAEKDLQAAMELVSKIG